LYRIFSAVSDIKAFIRILLQIDIVIHVSFYHVSYKNIESAM